MSVQPVEKICVVCQRDVSSLPRTKDHSGRYYCGACWKAKTTPFTPKLDAPAVLQPDENSYGAATFVPDELKSQL